MKKPALEIIDEYLISRFNNGYAYWWENILMSTLSAHYSESELKTAFKSLVTTGLWRLEWDKTNRTHKIYPWWA